ncbi:hypothetical protein OEZ86_007657 [Tetradesmus obliquus]|nr:hypothetical protein OEZ86_007657 [Tetradesmus obliquus]
MELVGFTLIIDDIVLPDGQTCMAQLGGGGPQTLFGFQLVSAALSAENKPCNVGLAAGVGKDLPEPCKEWLRSIGCNTAGLLVGQQPTPRAWQVFEEDGRRTQIWRVRECDELYQQLRPSFAQLPAAFQASRHYHLGIHAGHAPMKLLRALREASHARGGLLSVETYTACDSPPPDQQLAALLQAVDIFSPNEAEAASIVGPGSPQQLVQRLLAAGARTVSLRMGPEGVLVADGPSRTMWHVPAVPGTRVVDVTGCGNAFCGGFVTGLHAGLSMLDAARWGCVAGSIMAEWQGVPPAEMLTRSRTLPVAASSSNIMGKQAAEPGVGLRNYYKGKIEELELMIKDKSHNLRRLEAQRNELNTSVRMLREELQLLQEPGSYVGEVIKVMGKSKVLVKVHPEGKYVVDIDKEIDIAALTPGARVALRNDSYALHILLPSKIDPLVSLMKVEKVPDSTYDMIGGCDQQIKEIKEVIELPLKHPELFESLGIAQPKGVLLYGPPGTGKTLLARAVAHHTDCTFIRVSGSELVQKYIGEGSRMVRELFVMAREHAPSIIFMDEVDSIGSARTENSGGGGDSEVQRTMLELLNQLDGFEASNKIKVGGLNRVISYFDSFDCGGGEMAVQRTMLELLNQLDGFEASNKIKRTMLELLNQLDGFEASNKIKVLMATNRIDILDSALLRPGRIDRKIEFPNPSESSRVDILRIHSRKMNLTRGIDLKRIADKMSGASGAELKACCTEAGMFALRERRVHVTQEDFEMAVAKVMKKDSDKNMSVKKLWK